MPKTTYEYIYKLMFFFGLKIKYLINMFMRPFITQENHYTYLTY